MKKLITILIVIFTFAGLLKLLLPISVPLDSDIDKIVLNYLREDAAFVVLTDQAEIAELLDVIEKTRFRHAWMKENDSYAGEYCRIQLYSNGISQISLDVRDPLRENTSSRTVTSTGLVAYNPQTLYDYVNVHAAHPLSW